MQSSNPVLTRAEGFNGKPVTSGVAYPAPDHLGSGPSYAPVQTGRMTIDSVVQKTALTLGLVVVGAVVSWLLIGDIDAVTGSGLGKAYALSGGGAIGGLVLAMLVSFKRTVAPALVVAYALVEGLFVGAFSKIVATWVGDFSIVVQAVLGTFLAFGATLFVYKFFNIKVSDRFRRIYTIALMGFVGLLLVNFVLSFFNADLGLRNFGGLGLVIGIVALVFATISLIMDFDMVERGIAAGLPEQESWRAAFGLTVTLVWIYIELLRILAILRNN
ncbi:MAG: Bax inhibitor-1/YccA family protein [Nocardioidaceae bacterium]